MPETLRGRRPAVLIATVPVGEPVSYCQAAAQLMGGVLVTNRQEFFAERDQESPTSFNSGVAIAAYEKVAIFEGLPRELRLILAWQSLQVQSRNFCSFATRIAKDSVRVIILYSSPIWD